MSDSPAPLYTRGPAAAGVISAVVFLLRPVAAYEKQVEDLPLPELFEGLAAGTSAIAASSFMAACLVGI